MFDLLCYLLKNGRATQKELFPLLDEACLGLPSIDAAATCAGDACNACRDICPVNAIQVENVQAAAAAPTPAKEEATASALAAKVSLDLGACIGCGLCVEVCPVDVFKRNRSTAVAVSKREDLILTNEKEPEQQKDCRQKAAEGNGNSSGRSIFKKSLAVRVVSTGCSACDLEIGAASNPIFDMERFGIQVVASPRMADALLVTGPVANSMQNALVRTYEAMPDPKVVIAAGTCAISGGVHKQGYASANGVSAILPVDIFIPGCPPHPWNIIHGLMKAMGRI